MASSARRIASRGVFALVAGLLATASPGWAETEIGADLGLASHYIWRGVTVVNRPVLQPSLWASQSFEDLSVTLSLWGNVEIGKYDARSALSEAGGVRAFDLTELDPTLEVAYALGEAELAAGIGGYLYTNGTGYTHDDDAAEVYARLTLPGWEGVVPSFSVYQDITEIHGTYVELGLARSFALREDLELTLSGAAGWSFGQGAKYDSAGDVREPGNFEGEGFTHAELGVALPFELGSVSVEPSAHVVFAHDEATQVYSGTSNRDVKFWFGIVLSASRAFGE